jgi:hypothetical protein
LFLSDRLAFLTPGYALQALTGRLSFRIMPRTLVCATDPASQLLRDPADPEGPWSLWDWAKHGEREKIVEIAKTPLRRAWRR